MDDLKLEAAAAALRERLPWTPEFLATLGSGLGFLADAVEDPVHIPFSRVPGLPEAGVAGHAGRFVAGVLEGRRVLIQAGRFHLYEGYPPSLVVAPVRIARRIGVPHFLVTNAAGGVNRDFGPGTLMLIRDHLNLTFRNPLVGEVQEGEERFPDMTVAYDAGLRERAREAATAAGVELREGVYAAVSGPSYETPAEIRMLRGLGADAVGMSTVPEVVAARAGAMKVVGISLITNAAAGVQPGILSHQEVMEAGAAAQEPFQRLIRELLKRS